MYHQARLPVPYCGDRRATSLGRRSPLLPEELRRTAGMLLPFEACSAIRTVLSL